MPAQKINTLISELHELFGDDQPSAIQQQLMRDLQNHTHNITENEPVEPTLLESMELILDDLGDDHPRASAVIRELMEVLRNIGV